MKVVRTFISEPERPRYSYALARESSIEGGTARSVLYKLEEIGWVENIGIAPSTWGTGNRQARQLYRITDVGLTEGRAVLESLRISTIV